MIHRAISRRRVVIRKGGSSTDITTFGMRNAAGPNMPCWEISLPAYPRCASRSMPICAAMVRRARKSTLHFAFKGKSGKVWDIDISDRRMAGVMRTIEDLPGQRLFRYREDDGSLQDLGSHDVNAYIREVIGERFSSKDFRTWGGTMRALSVLANTPVPETKTGKAKALNKAIDLVSRRLGNTRAVCRACYIHPAVFERWEQGKLDQDVVQIRRARPQRKGLDREETLAAVWLQRHAGG